MRLIHITDPHLTSLLPTTRHALRGKRISGYLSWRKSRRHHHLPRVLEQLARAVSADQPDRILLTGDLMHIGLPQEAADAAAWLRSLAPPDRLLLVPGNHDVYAADSMAAIERYWNDYLPASGFPCHQDLGDIRITGLNSAIVTPLFSARGSLGPGQLATLPTAFERNRFNVLLIHHPPLPGIAPWRKALREARTLAGLFRDSAPDLALYGHLHRNRLDTFGDSRLFCTASASGEGIASYRIFDIRGGAGRWSVSMQLKSLQHSGQADGQEAFRTSERLDWEVERSVPTA